MEGYRCILIVDDEVIQGFVLKRALSGMDGVLEIEVATSGRDALNKAKETSFDLFLIDLMLPDVSGVALSETIRSLSADAILIWMTAYGCHRFAEDASRLDVHCCLDKPFRIDKIRQVVQRAFEMTVIPT